VIESSSATGEGTLRRQDVPMIQSIGLPGDLVTNPQQGRKNSNPSELEKDRCQDQYRYKCE